MRSRPRLLTAAFTLVLVVVACGEAETDTASTEDADATAEAPEEPAEDPEEPAEEAFEEVDLAVAPTELGDVLVDGDGMTLYLFTQDPAGESVCEDDCAAAWPPLVVDGEPEVGDDVDPALVGTIERGDGGTQVTYADSPLYTWASDGEPGDVTGQGVNDVWFVVSPDGEAVEVAQAADEEEESDSGPGGY